jgi:hypothetical protein
MNNNTNWKRRGDSSYRSTARGNNGMLESSGGYRGYREDSDIYENEFGDRNNSGYQNQRDTIYNNPYGYDQGSVDDNTAHSYNSYNRRGYRGNRGYNRNDDRNFFERAGDKIRETWNDWTDRDERYDNDYNDSYNRGSYGRNDRNFFERAGDKIRETWNDWTDNDRDEERYSQPNYRTYGSNGNGNGYSGRSYNNNGNNNGNGGWNRNNRRQRYGSRDDNYFGRNLRYDDGMRY